jgi:RNase P/RNase MRP subunit p30
MRDLNLFRVKGSVYLREVSSKDEVFEDIDCDGFLVRASEDVCRSIVASLKDKKLKRVVAFVGGDDLLNRRAVETLGIDYLVSAEGGGRRDTLKQRNSGLNHVVAKLAREKGVKVVVSMSELDELDEKEKARRIARVMQNVLVCRRAGCELRVASLGRNKKGVVGEKVRRSFGVVLGMSSGEVRDCVLF